MATGKKNIINNIGGGAEGSVRDLAGLPAANSNSSVSSHPIIYDYLANGDGMTYWLKINVAKDLGLI